MSSSVWALIEKGTSSSEVSRLVAVTMIVLLVLGEAVVGGASCARAGVASARATTEAKDPKMARLRAMLETAEHVFPLFVSGSK